MTEMVFVIVSPGAQLFSTNNGGLPKGEDSQEEAVQVIVMSAAKTGLTAKKHKAKSKRNIFFIPNS